MTTYKNVEFKADALHSFVETKRGSAYAYRGKVKTYANKTQAQKHSDRLNELGYKTFISFEWPFLIHELIEEDLKRDDVKYDGNPF